MSYTRVTGRLLRAAAALTVAALGAVALPSPASAAESYVRLFSAVEAQAITVGTAGKEVGVRFGAYSVRGADLPDTVTAKVEAGPAGVVGARLKHATPGCAATGGAVTCTKPAAQRSGPNGDLELVLTPGAAAAVGGRATITVTVSAPGFEPETSTFDLLITESGPDLRARNFTVESTPGSTVSYRPTFHNGGDETAETLILSLSGDLFAGLADRFGNCHYSPEPSAGSAVCVFRGVDVAPGETVTVSAATPVRLSVTPDVPGRTYGSYRADVTTNNTGISGYWEAWPKGTGPELRWDAPQPSTRFGDADFYDNQGFVAITTPPNPSDVVAQGATAPGRVGETVTVRVGMTNKGPGYINGIGDGEGSDPDDPYNAGFRVTFPAGVEVVGLAGPDGDAVGCRGLVDGRRDGSFNEPGRRAYQCLVWSLAVGDAYTVEFRVRITGAVTADGTVVANGGSSDPVQANNTAAVRFTADGGGLPITGVNVGLATTAGVLLLAAGAGVFLVAKRRRTRFVVAD